MLLKAFADYMGQGAPGFNVDTDRSVASVRAKMKDRHDPVPRYLA